MDKRFVIIGVGLLSIIFFSVLSNQNTKPISNSGEKQQSDKSPPPEKLDVGKELAKNMATGEVILMATCMGKNGNIPRSKMGDYIAAAVEEQGMSRQELFDNWDKYWGYAKDAEKRNGTSCLN